MAEEDKKPWLAHLPGILTGAAAFTAAMTAVYVNLRGDHEPSTTPVGLSATIAPSASTLVAAATKVTPASVALAQFQQLRLQRIQVVNDGSMGTTDWIFEVQVDGRPLFSLPKLTLSDKPGQNLVAIEASANAQGIFQLTAGKRDAQVVVRGWKDGLLGTGKAADVEGHATIAAATPELPVEVKSSATDGASFVLYLSTTTPASAN
ncbi:MAG TPA: hypothetical protein VKM35_04485 [Arenimonas sp.]|uniref:hypothetical protein n=1 Tax=Arenimonas sp. TaxID=1872635 RepID=UPI002CC3255D|nr:hypothetical protein [Arenimonas sp.]HMB56445.1 hypothetical protein [Arenimonas sp.]